MYNLKYHLLTIVSIFLALALGMVIGASLGGSTVLREASNNAITSLKDDYTKVLADKNNQEKVLGENEIFTAELLRQWSTQSLLDKNILLITDKNHEDIATHVNKLLGDAGAKVIELHLNSDDVYFNLKNNIQKVSPNLFGINAQDFTEHFNELQEQLKNCCDNHDDDLSQSRKRHEVLKNSPFLQILIAKISNVVMSELKNSHMHVSNDIKDLINLGILNSDFLNTKKTPGLQGVVNVVSSAADISYQLAFGIAQKAYSDHIASVCVQMDNSVDTSFYNQALAYNLSYVGNFQYAQGQYTLLNILKYNLKGAWGIKGHPAYYKKQ